MKYTLAHSKPGKTVIGAEQALIGFAFTSQRQIILSNVKLSAPILCLLLSACASMSAPKTSQLKLSQDIYISQGSQPRALHKQGEVVALEDQPMLLEAPGYVGLLLVPIKDSASQLEPTLKPIDEWSGDTLERALNSRLSEIVAETNRVQVLLSSKKEKEALEKIDSLQRKYPKISYLNLFRASALFMMGEREKSKLALEIALRDFPSDANARSFYESLGGTFYPEVGRQPASSNSKASEASPEVGAGTKKGESP